jgi:hypothetical protein
MVPPGHSDMCLQEGSDIGPLEDRTPHEQSHTTHQEKLDSTPPEESDGRVPR